MPATAMPPTAMPATDVPVQRHTADTLTSDLLLPGKRATPDGGWRRTVYRATGGLIRVGESAASVYRRDLINRVRAPVAGGHHRVAVLSLKGGVGKTTATVGLGSTLASLRGDRVIAVDGNPDRGTLSDKVHLETAATIRDLLNERAMVTRYADVRAYTSQASSRLEILASDRDPGVSVAFSADDYRTVVGVLEHFYSICITDCGTGLLHSAMAGILELADQVVLVSSPSVDGARSASATLDWLEAHDYGDLVRGGVVVLSAIRRKSKSTVDLDRLEQHFAARCRAVVRVPYDAHLEEGAEVELEMLNDETADAYLELAALVADGFAHPRRSVAGTTSASRSRKVDAHRRARLVADGGCLENNCVGRPTPRVRIPGPPLTCMYIAAGACSGGTGGDPAPRDMGAGWWRAFISRPGPAIYRRSTSLPGRFVFRSRSGCSGYPPCWAGSGCRACSAGVAGCRLR